MKKGFFVASCLLISVCANAQDTVVPITSFENMEEVWAFSGGNVAYSAIEELPTNIPKIDGPNALAVVYDNAGSTWQWVNFNMPVTVDISGMREIRMWVYWNPTSGDRKSIRLDLSGGVGLGTKAAAEANKWVELVWPIDRFTSPTLTAVNYLGGFISPDEGTNAGELYIDKITAVRKAGTPSEFEEFTPYGFNEEADDSFAPKGWTFNDLQGDIGAGEVDPTEGSNYFKIYLGNGWKGVMHTTDAMAVFDRWTDVVDIQMDVRVGDDYTGGWVQFGFALQSGGPEGTTNVSDWDDYPENGFGEARDNWKTLVWQIDMSKHKGAFEVEGGWFQLLLHVNNDAAAEGQTVYVDNLRIGVGKQSGTNVSSWSLY